MHPIEELVKAIQAPDAAAVKRLISSSPDARQLVNHTLCCVPPLWHALGAREPDFEIVKALLEAGADPCWAFPNYNPPWGELDEDRKNLWRSQAGKKDVWEVGPTGPAVQVGHLAILRGNVQLVELLESYGMDIEEATAGTEGPMVTALLALRDQREMVSFLIARNFHRDTNGELREVWRASGRFVLFPEVLEELITAGYTMDGLFWPLLHDIIREDSVKKVEAVLRAGISPNALNQHGRSPLFVALKNGCFAVANVLSEGGGVLREGERQELGLLSPFKPH